MDGSMATSRLVAAGFLELLSAIDLLRGLTGLTGDTCFDPSVSVKRTRHNVTYIGFA